MANERIKTIRGLSEVGLTIGAIVTQESVKGVVKLSAGLARYAGSQGLGVMQRLSDVTDAPRHAFSEQKREELAADITRDEAQQNFVEALEVHADEPGVVQHHFDVLKTKVEGVHYVTMGIRTGDAPDAFVPMESIAGNLVGQTHQRVARAGLDPAAAQPYIAQLQQFTGDSPFPGRLNL
jgi:hypothetical protein